MTTKQFNELYDKVIIPSIEKMRKSGQAEYANDDNNIFANFDRVANDININRKQVIWCYLRKHLDGVLNFIENGTEQREAIQGRISDIIVYMMLLWASIEDDKSLLINAIDDLDK